MKFFVCYIDTKNKEIRKSKIGWPTIYCDNCMKILVTKGYVNKDRTIYSFHKLPNFVKLIKPVVITICDTDIEILELELIKNISKVSPELLNKSSIIKRVGKLYVDKYGNPLSEIEMLDILKLEFEVIK